MGVDLNTIVADVPKNSREHLLVRLETYHGHACADLRVFAEGRDGTPIPTPKGVAFRVGLLPAIIAGLQEAEAEARRRGDLVEADEG